MKPDNYRLQAIEQAKKVIKEHRLLEGIREHGEPLFLTVSGSHSFGFPSPNSDVDLRGAYIADSERFLGMDGIFQKKQKAFDEKGHKTSKHTLEYMSEDKIADISVDEIGHYLGLVSVSNSNRMEWPNTNLIVYESPEFQSIKELVNSNALSKELINSLYKSFTYLTS